MQPDQSIEFPAIALFRDGTTSVHENLASVQLTTRHALKHRIYDGLRIIDRKGNEYVVDSAMKIGTVGPLGGWSLFYGQKIRVALKIEPGFVAHSLNEVKELVLAWLTKWHGWESSGSCPAPRDSVQYADSVEEIIQALRDPAEPTNSW